MNPNASRHDLLYATDSTTGQVFVYAYPKGTLEGVLTSAFGPTGDCVDAKGYIWIPDGSNARILKYAHGGTSPIAVLFDQGQTADGCSIDPRTGDLAIANEFNVIVFKHAKGQGVSYYDSAMKYIYWGGYDNAGNFFIDGLTAQGSFQFAELPRGGRAFTNLTFTQVQVPGDVVWDGRYVTVGDQLTGTIYQVQVKSSVVTVVGQTQMIGAGDPCFQFTYSNFGGTGHQAQRIVATDFGGQKTGTVALWDYPAGGSPYFTFPGNFYPTGVAISPVHR